MKYRNLLIPALGLVVIAGCNSDNSSATREVSTPNPPYKSPGPGGTPDPIQSNPNIPQSAKDSLRKQIPGGG